MIFHKDNHFKRNQAYSNEYESKQIQAMEQYNTMQVLNQDRALMSDGRMVEVTPQTVTPPQYLTVGPESRERDGAKFRTQCGPTLASTYI